MVEDTSLQRAHPLHGNQVWVQVRLNHHVGDIPAVARQASSIFSLFLCINILSVAQTKKAFLLI